MSLSTFLNGRDQTQLRGIQMLALSDVGVTLLLTVTDDGGGGGTSTWAARGTVPCRLDPMGGRSQTTGGRIDERSTHVVTVPSGTDVPVSARFAISNRGTFEVTATRERTGERTRTFEVMEV